MTNTASTPMTPQEAPDVDEGAQVWRVTRFCCTSGMCLTCQAVGNASMRKRILQADRLTKVAARRIAAGWKAYDARASRMAPEEAR